MPNTSVVSHVLPAVVLDHQPRRIERLGQPVVRLQVRLLAAVAQVRRPPALVDRDPHHDRRVVDVALQHFEPLAREPRDVLVVVQVGVGHLARDEIAQLVGPVEEARILHLLVLARAVEAHRLRGLDVVLDGLVGGRRQQRLGPVALVEHHAQVRAPAVELQALGIDGHLAIAVVGLHAVHDLRAANEFERDVVQVALADVPLPRIGHRQAEARAPAVGRRLRRASLPYPRSSPTARSTCPAAGRASRASNRTAPSIVGWMRTCER